MIRSIKNIITKRRLGVYSALIGVVIFTGFACGSGNKGALTEKNPTDSSGMTVRVVGDSAIDPAGKRITYNGHSFDTYTIRPSIGKLNMYWKDDKGKKLKDLAALKTYVESQGKELLFATNAGMYTADNSPLGLYIENGKKLIPLNTKSGKSGNFYIEPNGVLFCIQSSGAVFTTQEFVQFNGYAEYATQSGPMLVHNDTINKHFTPGSKNVNIRSGVGLNSEAKFVFAISNEEINFYDFAAFFKDKLKCTAALYLDGAISKMYLPEIGRNELDGSFGGMVGVVR